MRWEDERYIRFYTRDTADWLVMSWQARGLFGLIMRVVDRAGILRFGSKAGLRGIAPLLHAPWTEIEAPLQELIDDGCVVYNKTSGYILIKNFTAAQEAGQSDAARKRRLREEARALALAQAEGIVLSGENGQDVPKTDTESDSRTTLSHYGTYVLQPSEQVDAASAKRGGGTGGTAQKAREAREAQHSTARSVGVQGGSDPAASDPAAAPAVAALRKLPRSELLLWGEHRRQLYETAVSKALGQPWGFEDRWLQQLHDLIGVHCADKSRIDEWLTAVVFAFVETVKGEDPKFWSSYQPKGLLRWLNEGGMAKKLDTNATTNGVHHGSSTGVDKQVIKGVLCWMDGTPVDG
jgi:hypothetical protein